MSFNHVVSAELLSKDHQYRKLEEEHAQVKAELERLMTYPAVNEGQMRQLKRHKLRLRDQMTWIEKVKTMH